MNNKVIGRDAMRSAELLGTLARDNYGCRKWFKAVEVAVNMVLASNSVLVHQGCAIIMSNDAAGCYDRIAHVMVNIGHVETRALIFSFQVVATPTKG